MQERGNEFNEIKYSQIGGQRQALFEGNEQ